MLGIVKGTSGLLMTVGSAFDALSPWHAGRVPARRRSPHCAAPPGPVKPIGGRSGGAVLDFAPCPDPPRPASRLASSSWSRAWLASACQSGPIGPTPPLVAGTSDAPREVNLIAKDYTFVPGVLDLVPGETILLHVVNGGLVVHEAVIGDGPVQDAWEAAEAATVGAPPGPTPVVTVPPDSPGVRVVVPSGERVDLRWTVPTDVPTPARRPAGRPPAWPPGWSAATSPATGKGMQIPIRWVDPAASDAAWARVEYVRWYPRPPASHVMCDPTASRRT